MAQGLSVFPGPSGPGLIEASLSTASRRWLISRFPGPSGPGLIEAGTCGNRWLPQQHFPGPSGPGLIEAAHGGKWTGAHGLFPGPSGPGLIEAADVVLRLDQKFAYFRGLPAPASLKHRLHRKKRGLTYLST